MKIEKVKINIPLFAFLVMSSVYAADNPGTVTQEFTEDPAPYQQGPITFINGDLVVGDAPETPTTESTDAIINGSLDVLDDIVAHSTIRGPSHSGSNPQPLELTTGAWGNYNSNDIWLKTPGGVDAGSIVITIGEGSAINAGHFNVVTGPASHIAANINLNAGNITSQQYDGGDISIIAGNNTHSSPTTGLGGNVIIHAGDATNNPDNGSGGNVEIKAYAGGEIILDGSVKLIEPQGDIPSFGQ